MESQKETLQFQGNKVIINHKAYWMARKSTNNQRTTAMSAAAANALGFKAKIGFGGVMDWHKSPYGGQYIEVYALVDQGSPMHGPRRCYVLYDRDINSSDVDKKNFSANVVGYISIKNDKGYSSPPSLDTHRPNVYSLSHSSKGALTPFHYGARNAE